MKEDELEKFRKAVGWQTCMADASREPGRLAVRARCHRAGRVLLAALRAAAAARRRPSRSLEAFRRETDIYTLGDAANHCYVLVRGMVRFALPLGKRTAAVGEIIRSGELFGWAALIRGAQRRMGTASCVDRLLGRR